MNLLELKDVEYIYRNKYQSVHALRGITASFERGKVYAIIGKSGSGKSTLLSLMAGLDIPTSGDVIFEGKSTRQMKLDNYRRRCSSVIYQSYNLMPMLTVAENIMYPMELNGMKPKKALECAMGMLNEVGLPENTAGRLPSMLSGGEQQRVAIARALAMNTHLLLADEPTGNLDEENTKNVISTIVRLSKEKDYCSIVITHDLGLLPYMDMVYHMNSGNFEESRAVSADSIIQ